MASTTVKLQLVGTPASQLAQERKFRAWLRANLVLHRDFGTIPGSEKRPKRDDKGALVFSNGHVVEEEAKVLFKPGAEKIAKAHGLYARYEILEKEVNHSWDAGSSGAYLVGLYRYVINCQLIHRSTGKVVGEHSATCSTLEVKYRDQPRLYENTVHKMACKRALVAVVLNVFALSDEFTQDMEERPDVEARVEQREVREARRVDRDYKVMPMTVYECMDLALPGLTTKENPYAGKALRDVPSVYLRAVVARMESIPATQHTREDRALWFGASSVLHLRVAPSAINNPPYASATTDALSA